MKTKTYLIGLSLITTFILGCKKNERAMGILRIVRSDTQGHLYDMTIKVDGTDHTYSAIHEVGHYAGCNNSVYDCNSSCISFPLEEGEYHIEVSYRKDNLAHPLETWSYDITVSDGCGIVRL